MSGWKSWSIGEVVQAGDFQDLVQDQVVQTYADAATRTSTLGTAVTEGMMAFTADDDNLAIYANNNWNTVSQAISPNYIINGAFDFWQRGTSFTPPGLANTYTADRWAAFRLTGATITQQSFTPAEINANGFGGANFYIRIASAGATTQQGLLQRIEDVRTLAGQTVTFSFWAKSAVAEEYRARFAQNLGVGGSAQINGVAEVINATTSWQRFSFTRTLDSLSGLTIGTNSYLEVDIRSASDSAYTLDLWGVQVEAGSVATPFRRNANSIQGELAACQRYFYALAPANNHVESVAYAVSTTEIRTGVFIPTTMRVSPTLATDLRFVGAGAVLTPSSYGSTAASGNRIYFNATVTGAVASEVYVGRAFTAGNLTLSAEL